MFDFFGIAARLELRRVRQQLARVKRELCQARSNERVWEQRVAELRGQLEAIQERGCLASLESARHSILGAAVDIVFGGAIEEQKPSA